MKLLANSNCQALDLNMITKLTEEEKLSSIHDAQNNTMKVYPKFEEYRHYKDIVYSLVNLECPTHLYKAQARSL